MVIISMNFYLFLIFNLGLIFIFPLTNLIVFGYGNVIIGTSITPHDAENNDYFGSSIAFLNNNTLLVGSPFHQSTGVIYIYRYISNTWTYWSIIFPNSVSTLYYGYSISTYNYNNLFATSMYNELIDSSKGNIFILITLINN